jgi:hypothetical protein
MRLRRWERKVVTVRPASAVDTHQAVVVVDPVSVLVEFLSVDQNFVDSDDRVAVLQIDIWVSSAAAATTPTPAIRARTNSDLTVAGEQVTGLPE